MAKFDVKVTKEWVKDDPVDLRDTPTGGKPGDMSGVAVIAGAVVLFFLILLLR